MLLRSPKPRAADSTSATVASSLTMRVSPRRYGASLPNLEQGRFDSGHPAPDGLLPPRDEDVALRTRPWQFESVREHHLDHGGQGGDARACKARYARFDSAAVVHGHVAQLGEQPACTRQTGVRNLSCPPIRSCSSADRTHASGSVRSLVQVQPRAPDCCPARGASARLLNAASRVRISPGQPDWDVAQLAERLSLTQEVLGSRPSVPAKYGSPRRNRMRAEFLTPRMSVRVRPG